MATSPETLLSQFNDEVTVNKNYKIWSQSTLVRYAAQAIRVLETDMHFQTDGNVLATVPYQISVVVGQSEYDLPDDFARVEIIQFNDGQNTFDLYATTHKEVLHINPNDSRSTPNYYYLRGDKIGLYPIPSVTGTLEMSYFKKADSPVLGGSDLDIDDIYVPAIIKRMAYIAWSSKKDRNQALEKLDDYNIELASLQFREFTRVPDLLTNDSLRKKPIITKSAKAL